MLGQAKLETLREQLNKALKKKWQEWEIPREADKAWPEAAKKLHADWWQARIARQREIDASIAAKAEFEYLYDKPYDNKKCVRVAGPFTVESLSPHRMLDASQKVHESAGAKVTSFESASDMAPSRASLRIGHRAEHCVAPLGTEMLCARPWGGGRSAGGR